MNQIDTDIPWLRENDKPDEAAGQLEMKTPIRPDSNIGRFVDGGYSFADMRPTSTVIVGSVETDRVESVLALWDTGSTRSCISFDLARRLGLRSYVANGVLAYRASMRIAVDLSFPEVELVGCDASGVDVIVGMDVISQGELVFIPDPENKCGYFRFVTK